MGWCGGSAPRHGRRILTASRQLDGEIAKQFQRTLTKQGMRSTGTALIDRKRPASHLEPAAGARSRPTVPGITASVHGRGSVRGRIVRQQRAYPTDKHSARRAALRINGMATDIGAAEDSVAVAELIAGRRGT
jgi:hypothetical protein